MSDAFKPLFIKVNIDVTFLLGGAPLMLCFLCFGTPKPLTAVSAFYSRSSPRLTFVLPGLPPRMVAVALISLSETMPHVY